MRYVMQRFIWSLILPILLLQVALWIVGKLLELLGDALQQAADTMRDEIRMWARVLFSVDGKK